MIANVSAHRRANAFALALEEQSDRDTAAEQSAAPAGSPPTTEEQTEQGGLLALAAGLDSLPKPQLDPEVKIVQRAQLVAAMEAMLQEGTGAADASVPEQRSHRAKAAHRASPLGKLRPRSRLTKGLAAGGLSVSVAAGAFGGVAAASSNALPGDSLYGLKRGIEDFRLNYLADGDDQRGQTYLDQASTRLSEARRLMERGRSGHLDHESIGEIRRTLSGMQRDVTEGHRLLHAAYEADPESLGPIQALSTFSQSHREAWSTLSDRLPVQLGDVKQQVSSVFDAIDEEVAPLQSQLPRPPARGGGDERRASTGPTTGASGASGTRRSTPPSSDGSTPSAGEYAPNTGGSTSDPSSTATTSSDGLLGGSTGGLLEPPKTGTGSDTPSTSASPTDQPDVTLPPLLPGLLPGLGIDSEDAG
ncbi:hypothetical protein LK07_14550 [Streptomyces pluripotens]|uniref:DUF5667 domain-containing protein n=1 Tax=Streptomyces pluripotens TaxID=1355015 RepID=A0A221NYS3_9ACTN|nr:MULTISPECIES: DUF5667 domain-containing protein [Streptomyces]ARP70795.1 hypothetical protein LK06_013410 [Streptomyces pluripotens]ASN25052.1 hypothetical protein LK07_14550 [Streptomyces pluripotens]KIE27354.1 hypothetical protein LK08_08180 [Streptomyces sp. MUSC 125]MCH0556498.1 hypothetical protein [Streptomyces sp. MUM 16J]